MSEEIPSQDGVTAGAKPVPTGLHNVLADATGLLPPAIMQRLNDRVKAKLKALAEEGNYVFWMDLLFRIGGAAEEWGLDAEVPPDFWHNLAGAARGMVFPQFIPYAIGKAAKRPKRKVADVLAAIVVIQREVGGHWPGSFPDQPRLLEEFVRLIAAVNAAYPELFKTDGSKALASRFAAEGCNQTPAPAAWYAVREQRYYELFPLLFEFVLADRFPDSLSDERWSIISFNSFEMRVSQGVVPFPEAKVWWA